ncbi:c-type cytochrome [Aquibaculum sediminis]|uniref:c-type cytochrome n=1 Tax=Aquibaculum sediminis TaxID=3231907 RepID=UPI0034559024
MRLLAILATLSLTSVAQAADPEAGQQLARDACAFCHVVEDGGRGSDAVPSFAAIAREAGDDIEALRSFSVAPHPQMPQFADLSEVQVDNLIAYMRSLAQ